MAPKGRDGKGIFATRASAPPKRKAPEARGKKAAPPSRPMVELEKRLAAETRRSSSGRLTLTQRVGRAFPLFGFIGIRELGLIVAIGGAVMTIWHDLRPWGFLVAALGLVTMRYGPSWFKGPGEE